MCEFRMRLERSVAEDEREERAERTRTMIAPMRRRAHAIVNDGENGYRDSDRYGEERTRPPIPRL
jgi:hypothetical protein